MQYKDVMLILPQDGTVLATYSEASNIYLFYVKNSLNETRITRKNVLTMYYSCCRST